LVQYPVPTQLPGNEVGPHSQDYVLLFPLVLPTHQSFSGTSLIGAQHRTLGWVTAGSGHTHQQEERTSVRWEEPDPHTDKSIGSFLTCSVCLLMIRSEYMLAFGEGSNFQLVRGPQN